MRHIALITTSYPQDAPGSEAAGSFVEDFARELSRYVRVTVVAPSSADSVSADDHIIVRRFSVPRQPLSLLNPLVPTHWGAIIASLRSGQDALRQVVRDDPPDHILALWALPGGFWADRVGRQHGIRFSVWALGSDIWGLGKVPVVRQILKAVLKHADRRYADGLKLASDVEALCGMGCDYMPSARLLPPASSKDRVDSPPYNLAFLGRWHRNKGIDLLLDALTRLTDEEWDKIAEVRINGGGPLQDQVHAMASQLRAQGRPLTVGGYLDREAAAGLLAWAHYLLLPSRIESIPVIFSDAMQLNTPIIATPVGDLPRLHEKYRFGAIASRADAQALADAIRAVLDMEPRQFDDALRAARKDFDVARIAKGFFQDVTGGAA